MKTERIDFVNNRYSKDVRNIRVSDYKEILSVGNSVMIDDKKHIVIEKGPSKCVVMDLQGNVKNRYYKCIDYMFLTKETSKDPEIISFIKSLDIQGYSVVSYDKKSDSFKCKDNATHSYSFLLSKYLRMNNLAKAS